MALAGPESRSMAWLCSRNIALRRRTALPGDGTDEHSRYIEAVISLPGGNAFRVASIYAPNGNPVPSPKFNFKLPFLERRKAHARLVRV